MASTSYRLTRRGRIVVAVTLLALAITVGLTLRPSKHTAIPSFDDPIGALDRSTVPHGWAPDVDAAARTAGIPAPVLAAQLGAESKWNPRAVSGAGAQGLAQFTPDTWKTYGAGGNPFDPHDAIAAQGRLMRHLKRRADASGLPDNHVRLALAGYNAGFENIVKYHGMPPFPETTGYVDKIALTMRDYALPVTSKPSP